MSSNNLSTVRAIGKGARYVETATPMIVATVPAGFDADARGAVSALVQAWATGTTDETAWPAQKTGARGEQVTTDYGRGVDTLTRAVKRAIKSSAPKQKADAKYVTAAGLKEADRDAFLAKCAAEYDAAREAAAQAKRAKQNSVAVAA